MKQQHPSRPWLLSLGGARPKESVVLPSAALENHEGDSDSDDDGIGYQHWCSDEVFKKGGVRSVVGEMNVVVPVLEETQPSEVTAAPTVKRKKRSRAESLDIETLNHTRVLARPMTDILEVAPHCPDGAQAIKFRTPGEQPTLRSKSKPGRPAKLQD